MLETLWSLLRESATFLLAGLLVAALLDAMLAGGWLVRQLASRRPRSVVLATVVGLPLPLCSCSVLPSALALRERGASRGATLSFLISTPETSVTSILLSWGLLGPVMAVVRPAAACVTALLAGWAEDARHERSASGAAPSLRSAPSASPSSAAAISPPAAETGDAGGGQPGADVAASTSCGAATADCCTDPGLEPPGTFGARCLAGLRFAFGDLLGDIFGWVLIGIIAAAAISTWVPAETIAATFGDSWVAMPLMVLIGVPLYICAEASTPLAAALMAQGMSPGAALVLLLVGPATNIGALGALRSRLGTPTVTVYLTAIISVSLVSGVLLNQWFGDGSLIVTLPDLSEPLLPGPLENAAAVVFLGLGVRHWMRRRQASRARRA